SCRSVPEITRAYLSGECGVAVIDVDELSPGDRDHDGAAVLALAQLVPVIGVSALPLQGYLGGCHVLDDVFGDLDGLVHEVAEAAASLAADALPECRGTR